jgi:lactoylglutathione lyase
MQLDHIVINASDLATSALYYDALLPLVGMEKTRDHVWLGESGLAIDLRQAGDTEHEYRQYGAGVNHIGFNAPTEQSVLDIRKTMEAKEFAVPEIEILSGATCLFMRDCDGFRMEIAFVPN